MDKLPKAISMSRVSTREQAEGFSLDAQIKLLGEYAKQKIFFIVKPFVIPETATRDQERKQFKEMLEYLDKHPKVKILLCEKVDRITRNFKDSTRLDDWLNEDPERQIHFVKQSLIIHKNAKSHEKFQWDIYIALARQYSNNLSEEVRKGLNEKAEQGWWPGSHKRGYIALGEMGHKTWEIDESLGSEAPFIGKAFTLYDTGNHTLKSLSKFLFNEGWKDNKGEPISKTTLHKLLTDCFYCGEFVSSGKHYKDTKHPPLISKELFYRVQDRIRRKILGKYKKHSFLFQGLIKCGECGRSVIAEIQKGHNYYHCTHFKTNCSQKKYIREEAIETQILENFDSLQIRNARRLEWIRKALKESLAGKIEYHNSVLSGLNKQFTLMQERLDALYEDKLDKKITQEFYDRKFQEYTKRQEDILNAIQRHKEANINYLELGVNIFELSQRGRQIYEKKTLADEKRRLLNFVFSNLFLKDEKLTFEYKNAFQLLAERAKTGNWQGR